MKRGDFSFALFSSSIVAIINNSQKPWLVVKVQNSLLFNIDKNKGSPG